MATGKALDGKPYAGNPHVRFDEGEVAPAATPRRGALLYIMKVRRLVGMAFLCLSAVGCQSYDVRPLKYDPEMKSVTVVLNPKVIVPDFLNVMEDEFGVRGIPVMIANASHVAKEGEYVVTYDARQSWDFTTYLSDANVRVVKNNLLLGRGHYHHRGGSMSLSLWKWQGTQAKNGSPLWKATSGMEESVGRGEVIIVSPGGLRRGMTACRGTASRRFARLAVHPHGDAPSIRMEMPLPSASDDASVPGRPRHLWGDVVRFLSLSIPLAFLSSLLTR